MVTWQGHIEVQKEVVSSSVVSFITLSFCRDVLKPLTGLKGSKTKHPAAGASLTRPGPGTVFLAPCLLCNRDSLCALLLPLLLAGHLMNFSLQDFLLLKQAVDNADKHGWGDQAEAREVEGRAKVVCLVYQPAWTRNKRNERTLWPKEWINKHKRSLLE